MPSHPRRVHAAVASSVPGAVFVGKGWDLSCHRKPEGHKMLRCTFWCQCQSLGGKQHCLFNLTGRTVIAMPAEVEVAPPVLPPSPPPGLCNNRKSQVPTRVFAILDFRIFFSYLSAVLTLYRVPPFRTSERHSIMACVVWICSLFLLAGLGVSVEGVCISGWFSWRFRIDNTASGYIREVRGFKL